MSSSLIGTTINQQYLLTDILGEGGMGIVFKAEDLNLNNRLCAIKLLKGHTTDPNEVKRFEAELQIISRLRSPHVVQVLNKGILRRSSSVHRHGAPRGRAIIYAFEA